LSETVVRALIDLGAFKLWVPRRHGGHELELPQTLRLYEAAARIDGSVGWAVMIGAGGGLFAAYLEPTVALQLYGAVNAVVAGSGAPDGRAERIANGYRVSGRWRYASGAHYATRFTANCMVTHSGSSVMDDHGKPLIRAMSFAPADVKVIPTWNATGMRGTGSHDFEVHEVFVPEEHTFSVFMDMPRETGALYRLPFEVLTQLPIAAVGSGIARHALDAFAQLSRRKTVHETGGVLAEDATGRTRYAESHARWFSVHLALHALASRAWSIALAGGSLSACDLAEIAASCTHFLSELEVVVANLARTAGMDAILQEAEFARAWRDLQTLAAHASVSPLQFASAGATLLKANEQ
jgi:alkylation response protein AidB-like acyl-CoA dehydrogenase